ncbi:MAG: 16S rRNA (guanine(527)-N(7))-methyltransferase RsmG [Actinomycetes bacterium]
MKPTPELLAYFKGREDQIQRYAELLKGAGIERGLIGPKEGDRIWERHIANCIPITTILPENVRLVDIGSGAGLPGIVIALARPDLKVSLVEPLQRRVDFLNEIVAELGIPVEVIRGRAERVKKQFEIVTARAVAPLEKLINISWHMIPKGGSLMAMKGESAAEEIASTTLKKGSTAELHEISLPNLPIARVIQVKKGA